MTIEEVIQMYPVAITLGVVVGLVYKVLDWSR